MQRPTDKIISAKEVRSMTSLSATTIWRLEKMSDFPSRRQISPGRVGWVESEIVEWIEELERKRKKNRTLSPLWRSDELIV